MLVYQSAFERLLMAVMFELASNDVDQAVADMFLVLTSANALDISMMLAEFTVALDKADHTVLETLPMLKFQKVLEMLCNVISFSVAKENAALAFSDRFTVFLLQNEKERLERELFADSVLFAINHTVLERFWIP